MTADERAALAALGLEDPAALAAAAEAEADVQARGARRAILAELVRTLRPGELRALVAARVAADLDGTADEAERTP